MRYIKKLAIKQYGQLNHISVSKDFYDKLEAYVMQAMNEARQRAEANNRNTLMPKDL